MKKLTVLALVGAALLFTACNDKKETVTAEQEVAAKTGEVYNVDLTASKIDWKAFPILAQIHLCGTLSNLF